MGSPRQDDMWKGIEVGDEINNEFEPAPPLLNHEPPSMVSDTEQPSVQVNNNNANKEMVLASSRLDEQEKVKKEQERVKQAKKRLVFKEGVGGVADRRVPDGKEVIEQGKRKLVDGKEVIPAAQAYYRNALRYYNSATLEEAPKGVKFGKYKIYKNARYITDDALERRIYRFCDDNMPLTRKQIFQIKYDKKQKKLIYEGREVYWDSKKNKSKRQRTDLMEANLALQNLNEQTTISDEGEATEISTTPAPNTTPDLPTQEANRSANITILQVGEVRLSVENMPTSPLILAQIQRHLIEIQQLCSPNSQPTNLGFYQHKLANYTPTLFAGVQRTTPQENQLYFGPQLSLTQSSEK